MGGETSTLDQKSATRNNTLTNVTLKFHHNYDFLFEDILCDFWNKLQFDLIKSSIIHENMPQKTL